MRPAHYSKARIGGHPIHPMLVHFPIALFIGGLLSLIVFAVGGDVFWYRAGSIAVLAGVATGLFAAVFGLIDLFGAIPRGSEARRTGLKHMALSVLAVVLFLGVGLAMRASLARFEDNPLNALDVTLPLVLSIIGAVVLAVSGALGSKLVHKLHVGQELEPGSPPLPSMHGRNV